MSSSTKSTQTLSGLPTQSSLEASTKTTPQNKYLYRRFPEYCSGVNLKGNDLQWLDLPTKTTKYSARINGLHPTMFFTLSLHLGPMISQKNIISYLENCRIKNANSFPCNFVEYHQSCFFFFKVFFFSHLNERTGVIKESENRFNPQEFSPNRTGSLPYQRVPPDLAFNLSCRLCCTVEGVTSKQ